MPRALNVYHEKGCSTFFARRLASTSCKRMFGRVLTKQSIPCNIISKCAYRSTHAIFVSWRVLRRGNTTYFVLRILIWGTLYLPHIHTICEGKTDGEPRPIVGVLFEILWNENEGQRYEWLGSFSVQNPHQKGQPETKFAKIFVFYRSTRLRSAAGATFEDSVNS